MRSRLHTALSALAPLLAALAMLLAPCLVRADVAEDLRRSERAEAWREEASSAFWFGNFARLEQMFVASPGENPFDHSWRVSAMFEGIAGSTGLRANDAYYEQLEALTLENARAHPESSLAHLLYIRALRGHAWQIRGNAYAREVPESAWERFAALNRQAFQYLQMHKAVILSTGTARGYVSMIQMGREALKMKPDQAIKLFEAAVKIDPYDDAVYEEMLISLLPRWGGGSPEQIESFIRYASHLASPQWGHAMYARLYVLAFAMEYQHGLFEQSKANWEEMKLGFDDLEVRMPSIRNGLRYAYFACMAKDREAYRTQMDLLDQLDQRNDLKSHIAVIIGSNSERIWEDCRRWGASS